MDLKICEYKTRNSRCLSAAMTLQHSYDPYSAFLSDPSPPDYAAAVYSSQSDFLPHNPYYHHHLSAKPSLFIHPHVQIHSPVPLHHHQEPILSLDDWLPHSARYPLSMPAYSSPVDPSPPPRIKQEDLSLYPAISASHKLLLQQQQQVQNISYVDHHPHPHPSHHHHDPQPFALLSHFDGNPSSPAYFPHSHRQTFDHRHHIALPPYVHPAEVSPIESVPTSASPLSSPYEDSLSGTNVQHPPWIDDERGSLDNVMIMGEAAGGMVSMEDPAVGGEQDAQGEEDWSSNDATMVASQDEMYQLQQIHQEQDQSDSERDAGRCSTTSDIDPESSFSAIMMIGSQSSDQTAPQSEEEIEATASSEDDDFEDLTSSEEDEDDDDEDFVLNARPRGRRSRSAAENRRQRRRGALPANAAINGNHGTATFKTTSEHVSNGFVPYSMTEGRSLRSRSMSTRYTPYQGFTEFYSPDGVSGEQQQQQYATATLKLESSEEIDFDERLSSPSVSMSASSSVSMVRRRTRASPSIPIPVPVPNLTKKSRGRRVPTMTSLEDLRSAASGAGKKRQNAGGRSMRMYLCDVEGCGKCFARGEHLKRHVRSIHTYEKRKLSLLSWARNDLILFSSSQMPLSWLRQRLQSA